MLYINYNNKDNSSDIFALSSRLRGKRIRSAEKTHTISEVTLVINLLKLD